MTAVPKATFASYKAAALIYSVGPISRADLFSKVNFGGQSSRRHITLDSAIKSGWLVENARGLIILSDRAFDHFDGPQPVVEVVGQVAAPRKNIALTQPPMSKKYKLNPQGTRTDVPPESVRFGARYRSLAGSAA